MTDIIEKAEEEVSETTEEPMSYEDFIDHILENPKHASQSYKYLLEAIESEGTRTVIEGGEELERWCFFDDPYGNGKHAILGNTKVLNRFVDDLRSMASEGGENKDITWFTGPTATGKSELKRCLINGLKGYSKTEEGKRYTIEWNTSTTRDSGRGMTYGVGDNTPDDEGWTRSPVNVNPITVLPEETRRELLATINEDEEYPVRVSEDLDPFSREMYETIEEYYLEKGEDSLFKAITAEDHLRVSRYTMDLGDGIGVLNPEDAGRPKQRLAGSWMSNVLKNMDTITRKNPQAFNYDGVLCQGNNGVTILEDAIQHEDLLHKLLNVPENGSVKLDNRILMDIDTILFIVSNPDLEAKLTQYEDKLRADPHKAFRRRLSKYEFRYLTNISLEANLLRREITGEDYVFDMANPEDFEEYVSEPIEVYGTEFSPRAIQAAAMYSVVSRLRRGSVGRDLGIVKKAELLDKGYCTRGMDRITMDDVDYSAGEDGRYGITVKFAKDIILDIAQEKDDVVIPLDIIKKMKEELTEYTTFGEGEIGEYRNKATAVSKRVRDLLKEDVISAIYRDELPSEDEFQRYVENLMEWQEAYDDADEGSVIDTEDVEMQKIKTFEKENMGLKEVDYDGVFPHMDTIDLRQEKILNPITDRLLNSDADDISDIELLEIPVINDVVMSPDWSSVMNKYENLDPEQWREPGSGTETEEVKEMAIENMKEMFGYSDRSAEVVSTKVMENEILSKKNAAWTEYGG